MSSIILLIDPNPAVQAIASLALSSLDVQVQTLASRKSAFKKIVQLKPDLVFYAHDDEHPEESLKLFAQIKGHSEVLDTPFVLMVRAETLKKIAPVVIKKGITELLKKPFKSEQLRNTVERILGLSTESSSDGSEVLLVIDDPLIQSIFSKLLNKYGLSLSVCETLYEAQSILEQRNFVATIFNSSVIGNGQEFSKLGSSQMGRVLVVCDKDASVDASYGDISIRPIERPLSFNSLKSSIDFLLVKSNYEEPDVGLGSLGPEEQSILAARVGASVFELLLNQHSFRERNWEAAGKLVRDELLRVCAQFDALSSQMRY